MDRRELVLAVLAASEGRPYSPVQLQKTLFLITKNIPGVVHDGKQFEFVPYDYGPFDSDVYSEATVLSFGGMATLAPSESGRWTTYAASDRGVRAGKDLLARLPQSTAQYIRDISEWVRSQSFSSLVKAIYDAYPDMRANSVFRG